MATWQLGPMGDLRPLPGAEPSIDMPVVRYGGVHQGLSGARQLDVTGFRQNITLNFDYLEQTEWEWLNTLHHRLIPGPFYLIDPLLRNRLVAESSFPKVGGGTARGSGVTNGLTVRVNEWPVGVGSGGWATRWNGRSGAAWFRLARNNPAPFMAGDTVVASVYVKASAPVNGNLLFDWWDHSGQTGASPSGPTVALTTGWQRMSYSYVVPEGTTAVDAVVFVDGPDPDVFLAGAQLELGSVPTEWQLGGGAPRVLLDQMPTVSPRFPLTNVSVSLLEA